MEKKDVFRCKCPITSAIDIVGDKWSIVIVKHMLLEGLRTYKELSEIDEVISTNILSDRLKKLEEFGIITKGNMPNNKKSYLYTLTQNGLDLTPAIMELTLWAEKNVRQIHPDLYIDEGIEQLKADKENSIKTLIENYKQEHWS